MHTVTTTEASPRHRAEVIAEQYEALRAEAKAIEIQSKALSKELLALAKDHDLFEVDDKGSRKLYTQAGTYTLTKRVTESFMDAFKAYRIIKAIPLRLLSSIIAFDNSKIATAIQEGRMTEDQLAAIRDGDPKVTEYLTPGRPAKR